LLPLFRQPSCGAQHCLAHQQHLTSCCVTGSEHNAVCQDPPCCYARRAVLQRGLRHACCASSMAYLWLVCCVVSPGGDRPFLVSGADDRLIKVRNMTARSLAATSSSCNFGVLHTSSSWQWSHAWCRGATRGVPEVPGCMQTAYGPTAGCIAAG
jgi:hypothetical protein